MGRSHRRRPLTPRFFLASAVQAEACHLRKILARDQDGRCYYCLVRMTPVARSGQVPPPTSMTLDHKRPSSRGGTNDMDNLVAACRMCNAAKGDMTEEEFRGRGRPAIGRPGVAGHERRDEDMTAKASPAITPTPGPPARKSTAPPDRPPPGSGPAAAIAAASSYLAAHGRPPTIAELAGAMGRDPGHVARLVRKIRADPARHGPIAVAATRPAPREAKAARPATTAPIGPPAPRVAIEDMIVEGSCTARWAADNGYRWDAGAIGGDALRKRQAWLAEGAKHAEYAAIDVRTTAVHAAPDPDPSAVHAVDTATIEAMRPGVDDSRPAGPAVPAPSASGVGGRSAGEGRGEAGPIAVAAQPRVKAKPRPPRPRPARPAMPLTFVDLPVVGTVAEPPASPVAPPAAPDVPATTEPAGDAVAGVVGDPVAEPAPAPFEAMPGCVIHPFLPDPGPPPGPIPANAPRPAKAKAKPAEPEFVAPLAVDTPPAPAEPPTPPVARVPMSTDADRAARIAEYRRKAEHSTDDPDQTEHASTRKPVKPLRTAVRVPLPSPPDAMPEGAGSRPGMTLAEARRAAVGSPAPIDRVLREAWKARDGWKAKFLDDDELADLVGISRDDVAACRAELVDRGHWIRRGGPTS